MDDFSHNVLSRNDIVRAANVGRLDLCKSIVLFSHDKVREAICEAIQQGHTSVVEYLLTRIDYADLEIIDYVITRSVTTSIQNNNYRTIEVVTNSKLIDYVGFETMMKALVNQNCMDIVKKYWLNDERLETMSWYSDVVRSLDTEDKKVPLLSGLLEVASNLEMVKLLTSSKRFNKDHCNFAALKAVYDCKYDIFQYLKEYVDLRMFNDSLAKAAIAVNNIELLKYLVQKGCKVYVRSVMYCDDEEEMCSYLLENGEKMDANDCDGLKSAFMHRWYDSDKPGRLQTMKLILNHPSMDLDDLRDDLYKRLRYMEPERIKDRTSFPEWDLLFEFMNPSSFILSMQHLENLFIYVWEKYPVLQTPENMNHIVQTCDSSKVVEMILRDHRFDLSKIEIDLYHFFDPLRYDKFYVLCKDPRFVLTEEMVDRGCYLFFDPDQNFRLNGKKKDFQKLFLKKTQARRGHRDLWAEIDTEERESVQLGVNMFKSLDKTFGDDFKLEFTLKVMKYNEEVYRNSSIIGPDIKIFEHYTGLLHTRLLEERLPRKSTRKKRKVSV